MRRGSGAARRTVKPPTATRPHRAGSSHIGTPAHDANFGLGIIRWRCDLAHKAALSPQSKDVQAALPGKCTFPAIYAGIMALRTFHTLTTHPFIPTIGRIR